MLVTSVTTAAGDISIINQLYLLCNYLQYIRSNWPQSSSDLYFGSQQHYSSCNLAQYYQSHYLEKEISRETLKRGSKLFTEGNVSSFSQWSHCIFKITKAQNDMFQPFLAATCQTLRPLSASGIPRFNSKPMFPFLSFCIYTRYILISSEFQQFYYYL